MKATPAPSVPQRQLGRLLRQARDEAGIGVEAAADGADWSRAKMYRVEGGHVPMRRPDVVLLCQLYGVSAEMTEVLVGLAVEGKSTGWWHSYGDIIPKWFELYVGLEACAAQLRFYEPALIPGLLQTPEYAAAVFATRPGLSEAQIAREVALRMQRQRLLSRKQPAAPMLDAIIDESVLRRPIADQDAWRTQLDHLITAPRAYNVSVRVLPLAVGPHRASVPGSFTLLDFPRVGTRPAEPTTVYSESLTGSLYLEKPAEVAEYDSVWQALCADALGVEESASAIAAIIREMGCV